MQNQTIAGIDISSATLDICLNTNGELSSVVIANDVKAITRFFSSIKGVLLIGMENTGRYNYALYQVLKGLPQHTVFVIPPLHLKKSLGLIRGKNDKIDAMRIADFVKRHHTALLPWKPAPIAIEKLKVLLAERAALIKDKRKLLCQKHTHKLIKHLGLDKTLKALNTERSRLIDKQIALIETHIKTLIKGDEILWHQATLIQSVPGVGKVLCWMMLAKTDNFQHINDPRKMACYSGVAPFEHQSGTSFKGRSRVSPFADKALKTTLHMAAMSAIRLKNDLGQYYLRKVQQGKNKMSVLNAVRNKIIHRIFAVVRKQTSYQNILTSS